MSGKLSYEEVRRLARIWSAEARGQSAQDEAEIAAWTTEQRKPEPTGRDRDGAFDGDSGGTD